MLLLKDSLQLPGWPQPFPGALVPVLAMLFQGIQCSYCGFHRAQMQLSINLTGHKILHLNAGDLALKTRTVSLFHAALPGTCSLPHRSWWGGWTSCQPHRACGFLEMWPWFPRGEALAVHAVKEQKHRGWWPQQIDGSRAPLCVLSMARYKGGRAGSWRSLTGEEEVSHLFLSLVQARNCPSFLWGASRFWSSLGYWGVAET